MELYEFEIPHNMVGLIIGVKGKTINDIEKRADVQLYMQRHYDSTRASEYQICCIEGERGEINKCLHLIRHRFTVDRFPGLSLKPLIRPPQVPVFAENFVSRLVLPIGTQFQAYISAVVDPGQFFLQIPTHPTYKKLEICNAVLKAIYDRSIDNSNFVKPPKDVVNIVCAVNMNDEWYRALILTPIENNDTILVKFVDYGGFSRVPKSSIRLCLRSDLAQIPFQAVECYLADIEPLNGTEWDPKAIAYFKKICDAREVFVKTICHHRSKKMPCVRLFVKDSNNKVQCVSDLLLKKGCVKQRTPDSILAFKKLSIVENMARHSDALLTGSNKPKDTL